MRRRTHPGDPPLRADRKLVVPSLAVVPQTLILHALRHSKAGSGTLRTVAAPAALVLCGCAVHPAAIRPAPRVILPAASASAPVPASPAAEPVPPAATPTKEPETADVLLYDGVSHADDANSKIIGWDKIAAAEQRRVLHLLFGRKYLTDYSACNFDSFDDLAGARRAGQFVPRVFQAALGAFTTPGEAQTLFLIGNGECGAGHVDNGGSVTLAVVDSRGVVARTNIEGGASLEAVTDLDGDGISEFLVAWGFTNMGITVESVALERFGKGKLVEVKAFGQVYQSNCGDVVQPRMEEFTVIRAVARPGAAPVFEMEKKKVPCPGLGTAGSDMVNGRSAF